MFVTYNNNNRLHINYGTTESSSMRETEEASCEIASRRNAKNCNHSRDRMRERRNNMNEEERDAWLADMRNRNEGRKEVVRLPENVWHQNLANTVYGQKVLALPLTCLRKSVLSEISSG